MKNMVISFVVVSVFLFLSGQAAALERIDDLTVLNNGWIEDVPVPVEHHAVEQQEYQESRGMNDGYVVCSTSDDIIPYDLTSYAAGSSVALPGTSNYPYDAVMNPDGSEIWIADASADEVFVLDRATNILVTTSITPGEYMIGIAFSGDGSIALATSRDTDLIAVIDTSTYSVTSTITNVTGGGTYACGFITYCPSNDRFYMSQWYSARLFEIAYDGSSVLQEITISGADLWQLVSSHDGTELYICDRSNDAVQIVDVASFTNTGSISVGDDPWGIDITADDSTLVVACEDSHDIYVVDISAQTSQVVSLTSNDDPRDVDILDSDSLAFCPSGTDTNDVLVIDYTVPSLVDTISFTGAGNTNAVSVQPQMGPYSVITPTPTPVPDVPSTSIAGGLILFTGLTLMLLSRVRRKK